MSYVKILFLIIVYTAFICVDLPFFSCNIENYLEYLYKSFHISKDKLLKRAARVAENVRIFVSI